MGAITIAHTNEDTTQRIINQQPLTFHVRFPYRYPVPKLVRITYDNNLLCEGPEGESIFTHYNSVYQRLANKITGSFLNSFKFQKLQAGIQ